MAMIVAGMDVSGDQRSGNHKFISLVFGTQESLDAITRRLGSEQIHMNMIKNQKTRNDIIRQVRFGGIECIGFCMRLEKAQTIARVKKLVGRKHRPSVGKIYKAYHFLVWRRIRDRIEEFLRHHGCKCVAYASSATPIAGTLPRIWVGNTLTWGLRTHWRM